MSRFTPTRVGTILSTVTSFPLLSVHPHTRGDNVKLFNRCLCFQRFTPTRVGTITKLNKRTTGKSVHPHTRGDNGNNFHIRDTVCGSPPHAWGQSLALPVAQSICRFTPTRVGTIHRPSSLDALRTVHPHTRGDNATLNSQAIMSGGSPPHAWGQ